MEKHLCGLQRPSPARPKDRKSTRLNSSHRTISYAVFCLKKKNTSNGCCRNRFANCCSQISHKGQPLSLSPPPTNQQKQAKTTSSLQLSSPKMERHTPFL